MERHINAAPVLVRTVFTGLGHMLRLERWFRSFVGLSSEGMVATFGWLKDDRADAEDQDALPQVPSLHPQPSAALGVSTLNTSHLEIVGVGEDLLCVCPCDDTDAKHEDHNQSERVWFLGSSDGRGIIVVGLYSAGVHSARESFTLQRRIQRLLHKDAIVACAYTVGKVPGGIIATAAVGEGVSGWSRDLTPLFRVELRTAIVLNAPSYRHSQSVDTVDMLTTGRNRRRGPRKVTLGNVVTCLVFDDPGCCLVVGMESGELVCIEVDVVMGKGPLEVHTRTVLIEQLSRVKPPPLNAVVEAAVLDSGSKKAEAPIFREPASVSDDSPSDGVSSDGGEGHKHRPSKPTTKREISYRSLSGFMYPGYKGRVPQTEERKKVPSSLERVNKELSEESDLVSVAISSVAISKSSKGAFQVAAGCADGVIRLLALDHPRDTPPQLLGEPQLTATPEKFADVAAVVLSSGVRGPRVAFAGDSSGVLRAWDVDSGIQVSRTRLPGQMPIVSATLDEKSWQLLIGSPHTFSLFDVRPLLQWIMRERSALDAGPDGIALKAKKPPVIDDDF